ncbi:hypothetical protein LCGC14_0731250 [marine sediment metagenome]|uniref:Uncharacterized protein n=1 Tax=marine sediment metagenome TaxID=412755 RepID=A0A0F9Q9K0_9ZZZZ
MILMANKINRIYIGAICNRDLDIFEKLKSFCYTNYNIKVINLLIKGLNPFNIKKKIQKKMKKYAFSLFIVKLLSRDSNQVIYDTLNEMAPNIPVLNSLNSVRMCEHRSQTFNFIERRCKKLSIPKSYYSIHDASIAIKNGVKIMIKLDTHNIPNLPKNDRIIGIPKNISQFKEMVKKYKEENLFFQEYLGKFDLIYKIYVIDRWAVSITSHNRLTQNENLSPLELVHIRVPIDKQFKRRILRFGRKIGMTTFGIDYIVNNDGNPYIVDVNDFPSFRRVPEAISLLSDYIYNTITSRQVLIRTLVKAKS